MFSMEWKSVRRLYKYKIGIFRFLCCRTLKKTKTDIFKKRDEEAK